MNRLYGEVVLGVFVVLVYVVLLILMIWRFRSSLRLPEGWSNASRGNYRLACVVTKGLNLLFWLVLMVGLCLPLAWIVMALSQTGHANWGVDLSVFAGFKWDMDALPCVPVSGLRDPVLSGQTAVNIDTSSKLAWNLFILKSEVGAGIGAYLVLQMRALFASVAQGEPFLDRNAMRLNRMGWVILVYYGVTPFWQYFVGRAVLAEISFNSAGLQLFPAFELNLLGVFIGVALLVLAGVLKEAIALHQEQALTI